MTAPPERDAASRLARHPADRRAIAAMAEARRSARDLAGALAWLRRALALDPGSTAARVDLARILLDLDRPGDAERMLRATSAAALGPRGWIALAEALRRQGREDAATATAVAAVAAFPGAPLVRYTLAQLRHQADDAAGAIPSYRRAIALEPRHYPSYANLAVAVKRVSGPEASLPIAEHAALLRPDDPLVRYGRALVRLACGDLPGGWEDYEWRWRAPGFPAVPRRAAKPAWDGVARPGTRLLIWPEQGVADQISFAGCVPDVVRAGQPAVLECDPRLVPLFRRSFPGVEVRRLTHDGKGREHSSGTDYDHHIAIGSLPRLYRSRLSAFPGAPSYMVPDPAAVAEWRARLAALGRGPKVGIAWRSGIADRDRAHKYPPLSAWRPVLDVAGVRFVLLQYGAQPDELARLEEVFGVAPAGWPDLDLRDDFDGVAALAAALDHVVACDGAPAVQAASVGAPVLMPYGPPDAYRFLGTPGLPWHPSIRVVSKARWADPWDAVMRAIADVLVSACSVGGSP